MESKHSWQEMLYIALGVAGLIGTWAQVFGYLELGFLGGNIQFWKETVTTPASTFIVVDIFVLAAAVFVMMFAEGRRLGIAPRWLWTYFLGSTLIGISCFVPLFLAHRERAMRAAQQAVAPRGSDFAALIPAIALAVGAVAYSLANMP